MRAVPMRLQLFLSTLALVLSACGADAPTGDVDSGMPTFGAMDVRWTLRDRAGLERPCSEFAVTDVAVRIGGPMASAPCEEGGVSFESLFPDRYPVVAEAMGAGAVRAQFRTNADVVAGERLMVPVVF